MKHYGRKYFSTSSDKANYSVPAILEQWEEDVRWKAVWRSIMLKFLSEKLAVEDASPFTRNASPSWLDGG